MRQAIQAAIGRVNELFAEAIAATEDEHLVVGLPEYQCAGMRVFRKFFVAICYDELKGIDSPGALRRLFELCNTCNLTEIAGYPAGHVMIDDIKVDDCLFFNCRASQQSWYAVPQENGLWACDEPHDLDHEDILHVIADLMVEPEAKMSSDDREGWYSGPIAELLADKAETAQS